jgi:DNA repair protein RadA/Sms
MQRQNSSKGHKVARTKTRWVCQECGFQAPGFLGRCTDCNSWNSLVEEPIIDESALPKNGFASRLGSLNADSLLDTVDGPLPLTEIKISDCDRLTTGIAGLDEVLGGGLVPGAVILLAGDPGIGKSTLLLQLAKSAAKNSKVLYVAGEESAAQVSMRAKRLGINTPEILICSEQNVGNIHAQLSASKVQIAIIDSIQSVYLPQISSAPGSVSQVRESAQMIILAAKELGVATILVGHVTKDGSIAGPRVLEHMVDVVLQCEGDRTQQLRVLRAQKNRFGSTQEIAIFAMTEQGLSEVDNPSALLLGDRLKKLGLQQASSGTAVIAGGEGNRSLLLEVQALVALSSYPNPRRVANGWDYNRLLQILAVLEKKVGLPLSRHDVYVNIVGGLDFNDPSGDLGVSTAIATSLLDRSIDPGLILIGEIGLTGEVRSVVALGQRLKEAAKLGFTRALVPSGNLPLTFKIDNIEVVGISSLSEALSLVMPGFSPGAKKSAKNNE